MISSVAWSYDDVSEKWRTSLGDRAVAVGWDEKDRVLNLEVITPPAPNVPGATIGVFVAPLSLLAATLILPRSEHARLTGVVLDALLEVRDAGVVGELETVVGASIEPWPAPARATEASKRAAAAMVTVERLSLDMAAAGAWGETA